MLDEDTGPFRHVVWMVSGTLVGLHQFPDADVATPFSERRVGLDHVAFGVADRSELEVWEKRLDQLGISHGAINDAGYGSGAVFPGSRRAAAGVLRTACLTTSSTTWVERPRTGPDAQPGRAQVKVCARRASYVAPVTTETPQTHPEQS